MALSSFEEKLPPEPKTPPPPRPHVGFPCWVMPTWRVSQFLPAEIGQFDLVIVDEASQSDLTALPALFRGQKMLVVGDSKQVNS